MLVLLLFFGLPMLVVFVVSFFDFDRTDIVPTFILDNYIDLFRSEVTLRLYASSLKFAAIVWGVTVVADSAQFSTAVSELAPPGTAGSALALQMALGFLLTGLTILAVGWLDPGDGSGWRIAFALLALGPAVGIVAMWRLRQRPEAVRMASGHR